MRLVRGYAPRAQLLEREHQLDGIEQPDHACELRRRQAAREPHELPARDVDVDEHAREREVVERHRLAGDVEIEPVRDDEAVDDVEIGGGAAVQAHDDAVLDDELRLRIERPAGRDEAQLGMRRDEQLAIELAAARALRSAGYAPASSPRCSYTAAASRTNAAVRTAA